MLEGKINMEHIHIGDQQSRSFKRGGLSKGGYTVYTYA